MIEVHDPASREHSVAADWRRTTTNHNAALLLRRQHAKNRNEKKTLPSNNNNKKQNTRLSAVRSTMPTFQAALPQQRLPPRSPREATRAEPAAPRAGSGRNRTSFLVTTRSRPTVEPSDTCANTCTARLSHTNKPELLTKHTLEKDEKTKNHRLPFKPRISSIRCASSSHWGSGADVSAPGIPNSARAPSGSRTASTWRGSETAGVANWCVKHFGSFNLWHTYAGITTLVLKYCTAYIVYDASTEVLEYCSIYGPTPLRRQF